MQLKPSLFYRFLLMIMLLGSGIRTQAQVKYEKESRVRSEEVPAASREWIAGFTDIKKIKWYLEENLESTSFEAKFLLQQQRYSIEFSPDGTLEDVEIEIPWDSIPEIAKQGIFTHLDSVFVRHKIRKIQIQYTGDSSLLQDNQHPPPVSITTRYELVVKGKVSGQHMRLFEITYDHHGQFLNQQSIILKYSDNLDY